MCVDMCVYMCRGMCIDMRHDLCLDMLRRRRDDNYFLRPLDVARMLPTP